MLTYVTCQYGIEIHQNTGKFRQRQDIVVSFPGELELSLVKLDIDLLHVLWATHQWSKVVNVRREIFFYLN